MPRRGGFGVSLDPFGTSRGGLGRYNITGESITGIAEYEAYAVSLAWQNGNATDAEYLASLQNLVDLAPTGTRERLAAENKLSQARFSIDRNKVTRRVNGASNSAERLAALRELVALDTQRLSQMSKDDSEAYREQVDRVAGTRADLRQAEYGDRVTRVNGGHGSTQDLLVLAQRFAREARGDPDQDDWTDTVDQLKDRVWQEDWSDAVQAFNHDRKSGSSLLSMLDARLRGLDPDSPDAKQLRRTREDLVDQIRRDNINRANIAMGTRRATGKVSDAEYGRFLADQYAAAPEGSVEREQAKDRLREWTFSSSEDKLRYQVETGKAPLSRLISFYKSYRATMIPGSERWRQVDLAIRSLERQGGRSGGGASGGGGGGTGKGLKLEAGKVIGVGSIVARISGGAGKVPPDFANLTRVNPSNSASWRWFENNRQQMSEAFENGQSSWTYYDTKGRQYQMPLTADTMLEMDWLWKEHAERAFAGAGTLKERNRWADVKRIAANAYYNHGGKLTMTAFKDEWRELDQKKQIALGQGRFDEYFNVMNEMENLARQVLQIPDGTPVDPAFSQSPFLSPSDKDFIGRYLDTISPAQTDPTAGPLNPNGDMLLTLASLRMNPEGTGHPINVTDMNGDGIYDYFDIDPRFGYVTQTMDPTSGRPRITFVVTDPADVVGVTDPNRPDQDQVVPRWRTETTGVTVQQDGRVLTVYQPIVKGQMYVTVRTTVGGSGQSFVNQGQPGFNQTTTQRGPKVPVSSIVVYEDGAPVTYLTIDGQTFVRMASTGQAPQLVLDPGMTISADGKIMRGGQEVPQEEIGRWVHWYGTKTADGRILETDGVGAPGTTLDIRTATGDAAGGFSFDGRSRGQIREEAAIELERERTRYGTGRDREAEMELERERIRYGATPGFDEAYELTRERGRSGIVPVANAELERERARQTPYAPLSLTPLELKASRNDAEVLRRGDRQATGGLLTTPTPKLTEVTRQDRQASAVIPTPVIKSVVAQPSVPKPTPIKPVAVKKKPATVKPKPKIDETELARERGRIGVPTAPPVIYAEPTGPGHRM